MRRHKSSAGGRTARLPGFTLIELLVVIAVIAILAALVLSTAGYVQRKGASSRAQTEIEALSTALESYKADNGVYPTNSATTVLSASDGSPTNYISASRFLYQELSGQSTNTSGGNTNKVYFEFSSKMLSPTNMTTTNYIVDPFGYSYGYSTSTSANNGSNFFDLWSTAGNTAATATNKWIKNW